MQSNEWELNVAFEDFKAGKISEVQLANHCSSIGLQLHTYGINLEKFYDGVKDMVFLRQP